MKRIVSQISTKPEINRNIFIQFVPVARDPLDGFDFFTKKTKQTSLIDNLVVLRVIIRPTVKEENFYPVSSTDEEKRYKISFRLKSIFRSATSFIAEPKKMEIMELEEEVEKSWVDEDVLDPPKTCFNHEECRPCSKSIITEKIKEQQ